MEQSNPVVTFRETRGITRQQLADLAGCDYMTVHRAENGVAATLPARLLLAMSRSGADPDAAEEQYAAFKKWKRGAGGKRPVQSR